MATIKQQIVLLLFLSLSIKAQVNFQWATGTGTVGNNYGRAVTVDASGNVYSTGFFCGTVDFDPGVGIYTLTTPGGVTADIFVTKYDPSGNFIWAKNMGGTLADIGYAIEVDATGNVYTTGYFRGTADFDPGPGSFTIASAGNLDIFICKLDASGNLVWVKSFGSAVDDVGCGITIDATGNIITAGYFSGVVDFDPGVGTFNLNSTGGFDVFVSKLDPSGNFVWAKNMGGTSDDAGNSVSTDATGNVLITGTYYAPADFDPGLGVFTLGAIGFSDVFVCKLDIGGNFVWAKGFGGTGTDTGLSINVDTNGNVYTTGYFNNTCDFDPGAGVYNLSSQGAQDAFINKFDAAGNFSWARSYGASNIDYGQSIYTDLYGGVYLTGYFYNTVDFDPGPGVYTLTSSGSADIFLTKLNSAGSFSWAKSIGSTGPDQAYSIKVDQNQNIYVAGVFQSTVDFDPGPGVFNLTANGAYIFVLKLCQTPNQPGGISGSSNLCYTSSGTYSIPTVPTATSYSWSLPIGWTGTSNTNTINITPDGNSGTITVTAINACGASNGQTLSITINPLPTITVNSGSICLGNSFTMVPGGANTYTFQGGSAVVSPTANMSYTVIGTNSVGCVSQTFASSNVTVNALPLPTIAVNSGSICSGQSFTMVPGGANNYTFQGGNSVVNPTVSSSFTVIGTSTAGCVSSNIAISNITVNTVPILITSANPTFICVGETATLNVNGALTYSWNPAIPMNGIVSPSSTITYSVVGTNSNNCTSTQAVVTISVDLCLGLYEAEANEEIKIYPNPSTGNFTIELNQLEQIIIYNSIGQIIYEEKLHQLKSQISLVDFVKGMYFVRIGTEVRKILKE